ncbi:MAG: glycine--tRNA ligase subunit beta [Thermodesulfobacteriota bacterium]
MPEFILEIGAEEIPARCFPALNQELGTLLAAALDRAMVDHSGLTTFATPRRIVARAELAETQRSEVELVTGPPKKIAYDAEGNPTKAAQGFAKTQGVDLADAFLHATDKGEYLAVRKTVGGARTLDILPALCRDAIAGLSFPKKMRWGSLDFGFGRPLRWVLALLGNDVVPFAVAGVASGRTTRGHRVMGPGPFEVASAADFFRVLKEQGRVVLDAAERRDRIVEQGDALAKAAGGTVLWKDKLLAEVTGLVESPRPILGSFDSSFLEVPREVLLTSMESHQKSFGIEGADGGLLPHFLATLNLEPKDEVLVRKGWERVLRARLEDARFFWKTDLAAGFDPWLAELDNVVFLAPLGSMGDKSRRLERLARWLGEKLAPDQAADLARAGRLAKADLVSGMVGEFDELQGVMGGIYADRFGESAVVAKALYDHYLPAGPESPVPSTLAGCLLSMADKADTLAGCFGLDLAPTGANDPYALRRAVLGICRMVIEKGLRLDLGELFAAALDGYSGVQWKLSREEALAKLKAFASDRLKHYFTGKGHPTLVVEAALGAGFADVWALSARVEALASFAREADFGQAVLTFKRAANIIIKQGAEAGVSLNGAFDPALLVEAQERGLADSLAALGPRFASLWAADDFPALLGLLRELRPAVDAFFDHVMVMCEDAALRRNRLNLLKALVDKLGLLADFSALQV